MLCNQHALISFLKFTICLWLLWVFVAECGPSLVVVREDVFIVVDSLVAEAWAKAHGLP